MSDVQITWADESSSFFADPYYCAGGVVERLAALGFTNVYNRNEDCYAKWAEAGRPGVAPVDYDILLTNPVASLSRALALEEIL